MRVPVQESEKGCEEEIVCSAQVDLVFCFPPPFSLSSLPLPLFSPLPSPPLQDLSSGFVLCEPSSPCHIGQCFDAQIVILEHKSIICAGYSAVLHIHTVVEEVQITVGRSIMPPGFASYMYLYIHVHVA